VRFASADEPTLRGGQWIAEQWEAARLAADRGSAILVLDEVQKATGWAESVKRLWDEDTRARRPLKVVLLGSAPLLVQQGLTESVAGRFEVLRLPHWSLAEMRAAFGFSTEQYVYFGGYPGAASLASEPERWRRYVLDSLIETTIARDVLLLARVDKPALLRRLFELGCHYSGQVLSYTKMLGQLHEAGNTTTLAHYLDLLGGAGLLTALAKYSGSVVRQRGSSPKLQVLNTALMSAESRGGPEEARADGEHWGRLVESAVGAHLANAAAMGICELFYWRERNREVDFVVRAGKRVLAVEVKSSRRREALPGMAAFVQAHASSRPVLVGGDGIAVEEFLAQPVDHWLRG
jgi:predicted AAA+ superfamily ATPase